MIPTIKKEAFLREETVKKIVFHNNIYDVDIDDKVMDFSANEDRSVIAWYTDPTTLHVAPLYGDKISANENSSYMFAECYSLSEINGLRNLDTSNVKTMRGMFMNCISLLKIDVSNFNTSSIKDISYMFSNCAMLKELDFSKFNAPKIEKMLGVFEWCINLDKLTLNRLIFDPILFDDWTEYNSMFYQCDKLKCIKYTD